MTEQERDDEQLAPGWLKREIEEAQHVMEAWLLTARRKTMEAE